MSRRSWMQCEVGRTVDDPTSLRLFSPQKADFSNIDERLSIKLRIPTRSRGEEEKNNAHGAFFRSSWGKAREMPLGGWGARIRTWVWRNQNPLPYHLATPQ